MKHTHRVIILFLLVFSFGYSQNTTVKVTYKKKRIITKKLKKESNESALKRINDFEKKQNDLLENVEFLLFCSGFESVFNAEESLQNEGRDRMERLAINLGGSGGTMYTNIKDKKQLWQKEAFGELFLVEKKIEDTKWSLTNEKKEIGNYICFKAVAKKRVKNRKGVFYDDVIAWYCPTIPLSFGPMEFCNLPGLILELEVSSVKFFASEINLNFKKKNLVEKPTDGKKVTYEELENIGAGVVKDMKIMMKE